MNISTRLYILLTTVIVALFAVAAMNLLYMQRVYKLTDYTNANTVPSLQTLNDLEMQFMKLRIRVYRRIINDDPGLNGEIEKTVSEARVGIYHALDAYERYVNSDEDRHYLNETRRLIDRHLASQMTILGWVRENRQTDAVRAMRENIPLALEAQAAIEKHIDFNAGLSQRASQEAVAVMHHAMKLTLGFSFLSIAMVSLLVFQIRGNLKARQIAAIVDTSDDAIISKTLDGTIASWNPGAERIFGYTAHEAIGQPMSMLIPADRLHEEPVILARIRRGERIEHFETVRQRKGGERIHISVTVSPLHDASGAIIGASKIARDITKAKLAEEALLAAKREAELANKAKSDFLANMSHEIRTPMNAIIGMTQLVLDSELAPRQENYLRKVSVASKALLRILNDILDYSKIEAGRIDIEKIPLRIEDILQQAVDLFGTEIEEKGLSLDLSIAPDVPREVLGDPLRLSQVLHNLLGNAIKFTKHGGIRITVAKVSTDNNPLVLRFQVSDTGIGLSPTQSEQLFKPFVQADSSVTRKYGGTGLGLAICQNLVGLMGGDVSVASQESIGSTFSFTIRVGWTQDRSSVGGRLSGSPVRDAPGETQAVTTGRPELPRFDGLRVLLAEDHAINQEIATAFLERLGAVVTMADNGAVAVDLAQQDKFDIVLLDLHMPVLDGLAAAQQIRERLGAACPPLVAMSAAVLDEDRRRCKEVGMVDFIAKPAEVADIAACFVRVLRGGQAMADPDQTNTPGRATESFDLAQLQEHLAGDGHLAAHLVSHCVETYAGFAQALSTMLSQGRLADAALALHTLRGVVGNLGIGSLEAPSRWLEGPLRNGQTPDAASIADFTRVLDAVMRNLADAALVQTACSDAAPDRSEVDISKILEQLQPYLEAGEVVPDDITGELQACQHSAPADSAISQLLRCIDAFDHQGALVILEQFDIATRERH